MPVQDSSLNGQVKSSQPNLADIIDSTAEKDTRKKPWQSTHEDGQAAVQEIDKMNGKDEYWMAEGSVNASS